MNSEKPKIRLLMVDDEEDFLIPSAKALERRGFEVHMAREGTAALQLIKQRPFNIVLLDVKMPGMDGVDVFRKIRTDHPELPVIILTGHGSTTQAFQTSKNGIADYLAKPCDIDYLAERIRQAVDSAETRTEIPRKPNAAEEIIRVLLVDDETELVDSLKKSLTRRNMEVSPAYSGEEALDLLSDEMIDVVVLDIKMPGMDGLTTLKKIRQRHSLVEVILLTGHPTIESALKGMKQGAREYLMKPPDIDELVTAIRQAFRSRQEKIAGEQRRMIDDIYQNYPE